MVRAIMRPVLSALCLLLSACCACSYKRTLPISLSRNDIHVLMTRNDRVANSTLPETFWTNSSTWPPHRTPSEVNPHIFDAEPVDEFVIMDMATRVATMPYVVFEKPIHHEDGSWTVNVRSSPQRKPCFSMQFDEHGKVTNIIANPSKDH
jgi:hypothetical protein